MEWKPVGADSHTSYKIPDRWLLIHYYEALNVLFRVENALRLFVYVILKIRHLDKWADIQISSEDGTATTIAAQAKKRQQQAKVFGYLGYDVTCPVMHLTSGELTRVITHDNNWPYFKEYFRGQKQIMETKLEEIGSIRNALAHFRPIKEDDVAVIKQNAKHTLMAIEECIHNLLKTLQIVPTNTIEDWYTQLKPIGTGACSTDLYQSVDERWIRVRLTYACPELRRQAFTEWITWRLLTVNSSAILREFPSITKHVVYIAEELPYNSVNKETQQTKFVKQVNMVFSKAVISAIVPQLKKDLEQLVLRINEETELVSQDHLARGTFVRSATASAVLVGEDSKHWRITKDALLTPLRSDDPPEYWGDFDYWGDDFVAGTRNYPWMPSLVSGMEAPF